MIACLCCRLQADIIRLPAGTLIIKTPIIISEPNTVLEGQGTILFIANNANCPAIIVNSTATNSILRNFSINGNRLNQTNECWSANPHIRNNGISIQGGNQIIIEGVIVHSCRSGGIVITDNSTKLTISRIESFDNQFDGIAAYATTDSVFNNLNLHDNLYAGLSFDCKFNTNTINNCVLKNNDVGVFMRDSRGNRFSNLSIQSKSYNIYQNSRDGIVGTECVDNIFEN